jgi:hypothetical protein
VDAQTTLIPIADSLLEAGSSLETKAAFALTEALRLVLIWGELQLHEDSRGLVDDDD